MRKLHAFTQISIDGYFVDAHGDMMWAHKNDPEWQKFSADNASGGGAMLFGRITYEMMASFWPTPAALKTAPIVAERMNTMPKYVFSQSMTEGPTWNNTRVLKGGEGIALAEATRALKAEPGPDIVILGSGALIAQLTSAGLIDTYQLVVNPLILGAGRTVFEGIERRDLKLQKTRSFSNGNVVLWYERV